ncbi:MAG: rhodanese-like domain-containing protein [Deltaproteobacteria bacterium]|nr:rhodanese-like domain-containing protein [Deltaproteobacteria bacterium]
MGWLPKIAIGAVVALVLGFLFLGSGGDVGSSEARRLVEGGALLVDVRTPAEFSARHIPGAVNIPLSELDARMNELGPRSRAVVLYCRSGNRSAQAARILEGAGYSRVHDLGAMSRW